MRVGALPQYPSNALNYNLTWSTDGLINEYIEPCEAIVEGRLIAVPAMEEREEFSLDGVTYEAFNTSGGLGTLAKTLEGRVRTMNYRTIRYPGHQAIIKALLNDFNLKNRRDVLKDSSRTRCRRRCRTWSWCSSPSAAGATGATCRRPTPTRSMPGSSPGGA